MFEIESNIPVPAARGKQSPYPFRQMAVGDSFFCPVGGLTVAQLSRKLYGAANSYARVDGTGKKFSVRAAEGGARVWRRA
jgi:hypothetical protein